MKVSTTTKLHIFWNNQGPKKALEHLLDSASTVRRKAEKFGYSVRFGDISCSLGDGTGMSVDAGRYSFKLEDAAEAPDLIGLIATGRTIEGIEMPIHIQKSETDAYKGSLSYGRKLGPNIYYYGDPRYERSRPAGIYLRLSGYMKKRHDKRRLQLLTELCGS